MVQDGARMVNGMYTFTQPDFLTVVRDVYTYAWLELAIWQVCGQQHLGGSNIGNTIDGGGDSFTHCFI